MNNQKIFSIAIDGPCGAGKSKVSDDVAKALDIIHLDTGAMYRAVGLYMLKNGVNPEDAETVSKRVEEVKVEVEYAEGQQKTLLMGEDVSAEIRTEQAGQAASDVSKVKRVRERMVEMQREIAQGISLIMDGRDIGTCVLPDATIKIYLTADAKGRAKRRYDELVRKNVPADFDTVYKDLLERDHNDMTRENSPLKQAEDACVVDTTHMTQSEVVDEIIALLEKRLEAQA